MPPAQNLNRGRVNRPPIASGSGSSSNQAEKPKRSGSDQVIDGVTRMLTANPAFTGTEADAKAAGKAEVEKRTKQVLNFVAAYSGSVERDGGELRLVRFNVAEGTAEVLLSGSCSTCALSEQTLYTNMRRSLAAVQSSQHELQWLKTITGDAVELSTTSQRSESAQRGANAYQPKASIARELGIGFSPT